MASDLDKIYTRSGEFQMLSELAMTVRPVINGEVLPLSDVFCVGDGQSSKNGGGKGGGNFTRGAFLSFNIGRLLDERILQGFVCDTPGEAGPNTFRGYSKRGDVFTVDEYTKRASSYLLKFAIMNGGNANHFRDNVLMIITNYAKCKEHILDVSGEVSLIAAIQKRTMVFDYLSLFFKDTSFEDWIPRPNCVSGFRKSKFVGEIVFGDDSFKYDFTYTLQRSESALHSTYGLVNHYGIEFIGKKMHTMDGVLVTAREAYVINEMLSGIRAYVAFVHTGKYTSRATLPWTKLPDKLMFIVHYYFAAISSMVPKPFWTETFKDVVLSNETLYSVLKSIPFDLDIGESYNDFSCLPYLKHGVTDKVDCAYVKPLTYVHLPMHPRIRHVSGLPHLTFLNLHGQSLITYDPTIKSSLAAVTRRMPGRLKNFISMCQFINAARAIFRDKGLSAKGHRLDLVFVGSEPGISIYPLIAVSPDINFHLVDPAFGITTDEYRNTYGVTNVIVYKQKFQEFKFIPAFYHLDIFISDDDAHPEINAVDSLNMTLECSKLLEIASSSWQSPFRPETLLFSAKIVVPYGEYYKGALHVPTLVIPMAFNKQFSTEVRSFGSLKQFNIDTEAESDCATVCNRIFAFNLFQKSAVYTTYSDAIVEFNQKYPNKLIPNECMCYSCVSLVKCVSGCLFPTTLMSKLNTIITTDIDKHEFRKYTEPSRMTPLYFERNDRRNDDDDDDDDGQADIDDE